MKIEQPILGKSGVLFLLVLLGAFPPLTMDLYLPALPQMAEIFETSRAKVNLTIGVFMVSYAIGILFWGPLSERTGRKPILFAGLGMYILFSLLCATAANVDTLIVLRIPQGFGGGGITVVGTAIIKDLFDGRTREQAMATIMSMVVIAPLVAPILGAFILTIAPWNVLFVLLALFGCVAALMVFLCSETLEKKSTGSILETWARLGVVLINPRFAYLLVIFAVAPMGLLGFIGIASYVYVDRFGLSEQHFSFFFAFNAAFSLLAPFLYLRLSRIIPVQRIILVCFGVMISGGVGMLLFGGLSQWVFAALAAVSTVSVIILRIPGANLLLEQQDEDTGSAAALIQFSVSIMGATGILIVTANSEDLIQNYGLLLVAIGTACAGLWLIVQNRPFVAENVVKPS